MLFEAIQLREVEARNRIVVSPMCQYSAQDGHVTDWHLVHLGKFAQGGAGVVFVEATAVEKRGRITHGDTGIWDDSHVEGLRRISSFVRDQGAIPAIQLAHAGRKASCMRPWEGGKGLTPERGGWPIIAPSEEAWGTPEQLTALAHALGGERADAVTGFIVQPGLDGEARFEGTVYPGEAAVRVSFEARPPAEPGAPHDLQLVVLPLGGGIPLAEIRVLAGTDRTVAVAAPCSSAWTWLRTRK